MGFLLRVYGLDHLTWNDPLGYLKEHMAATTFQMFQEGHQIKEYNHLSEALIKKIQNGSD